jgi:hypothetical protein
MKTFTASRIAGGHGSSPEPHTYNNCNNTYKTKMDALGASILIQESI